MAVVESLVVAVHEAVAAVLDCLAASEFEAHLAASAAAVRETFVVACEAMLLAANGPLPRSQPIARRITSM